MAIRTYAPQGYSCSIILEVTDEQAIILDKIAESNEFDAYFWSEKVQWLNDGDKTRDGDKVARINGVHYVIGREDASSFWKGSGGRQVKIKFSNGEEITTTNLWHQGGIPEELKTILKDNAEWVE
jgi:hypothetical protein